MNAIVLHNPADYGKDKEACERAWLKARTKGIGASEVANLLGIGYGSEYSTWAAKMLPPEPIIRSARFDWGHRHERTIVEALVEEPEFLAEFPGDWTPVQDGRLYQHRDFSHVLATPDYYIVNDKGELIYVECKTSTADELWADGVPAHVNAQVQQQMSVLGIDRIIVAWLLHGYDFHWCVVLRDEVLIKTITDRVESWWEKHVAGNVAPAPDGSDETKKAILRRFPRPEITDDVVSLPGEFIDFDKERERLSEQMKALETRRSEIDNKIKDAIGVRAKGMLPNGVTYSWALQQKKEYTVKASSTRVLRRSEPKEPK